MLTTWQTISAIITGVVCSELGAWLQRRKDVKKLPYTWVCPVKDCTFIISSDSLSVISNIEADHKKHHWMKSQLKSKHPLGGCNPNGQPCKHYV